MTNSFLQNIGAPGVTKTEKPTERELFNKAMGLTNAPAATTAPKPQPKTNNSTPVSAGWEKSHAVTQAAARSGRQLPPNPPAGSQPQTGQMHGPAYNNKPLSIYDYQELTRPIDMNMPEALQNSSTLQLTDLAADRPTGNERWTPNGYVTPGDVGSGGRDQFRTPQGNALTEHTVANGIDQKDDPTSDLDDSYKGPENAAPAAQDYANNAIATKVNEERSGGAPEPWSRTPGTGASTMEQQAAELRGISDALANRYIEPDDDYSGNGAKGSSRLNAALASVSVGDTAQAAMPKAANIGNQNYGISDEARIDLVDQQSRYNVGNDDSAGSGFFNDNTLAGSTRVNAEGVKQQGMDMSWKDSQNAPRFVDTPTDNATSNVTYSPTGDEDDQDLIDFNSSWSTQTQPGQFPSQFGAFQ